MDKKLAWGIEAKFVDYKVRCYFTRPEPRYNVVNSGNIIFEPFDQRRCQPPFLSRMALK